MRNGNGIWRIRVDANRIGAYRYIFPADALDFAFTDSPHAFGGGVGCILGLMLAGDDKASIIPIVEIGIELGDERGDRARDRFSRERC